MDTVENGHIEDGALLALLDGELGVEEQRRVEMHTGDCSECAGRRDELRFATRRVTAALEETDVASPWTELPEALREAQRQAVTPIASARSSSAARTSRRSIATAAGLTLLLAAGAYAIPGSPVRGWIDNGLESIAMLVGGDEEAPAAPEASQVSVEPSQGTIRVSILGSGEGLQVTIGLSDGASAAATALDASFRVEAGLIEVSEVSGDLQVTLPRSAVSGSVEVAGVEVARLESGELTRTEAADASPAEILFQTGG